MKKGRWIFILLFAASVAAAAVYGVISLREAAQLESSKGEKEDRLHVVHTKLETVNMKYRGLQKSVEDIPDSLRVYEAGNIARLQKEYHKQIFHLEQEDRELNRLVRKDHRAISAIHDRIKRRMYGFGVVTLVFLVAALIAGRASIRS
jgi:predicted  nucleic acid-binding Zn-ribbon protein